MKLEAEAADYFLAGGACAGAGAAFWLAAAAAAANGSSLANQVSGAPSQAQPQQQPATTNDAGAAGNQSAPAVPLQQ